MPATNRQFKAFVKATGHITTAQIPPDPKNYPCKLPEMIDAGSLVFPSPPRVVELRDGSKWWTFMKDADVRYNSWRRRGRESPRSISTLGRRPSHAMARD